MGDEPRKPLERALELFVFAPVGLALAVRDELPRLIEAGRRQMESQLAAARVIGRFAVSQGQREVAARLSRLGNRAPSPPAGSQAPAPASPTTPPPASTPSSLAASSPGHASARPVPAHADGARPPARVEPPAGPPSPSRASLAIPDYDSLAASQVVQRLAGLSPDELEAVRDYEAAHRGRRTILARVAQLQAGAG